MKRFHGYSLVALVTIALVALSSGISGQTSHTTPPEVAGERVFPETGLTVRGRFLEYWDQFGGLAQFGNPISTELPPRSDINNETYTVQYFERTAFEYHSENKAPYDVLLSLLGREVYQERYPNGAPNQRANNNHSLRFPATDKTLGGPFRTYWEQHGGLPELGYPISDEFQERSALDGKLYKVQYFERAVLELHPENAGTAYEVLLSQVGSIVYSKKIAQKGNPQQKVSPLPIPTPNANQRQLRPQGSPDYLVWQQERLNPIDQTLISDSSDIIGLNIKSGKVFTITEAPCDQFYAAISGSVVVWQTVEAPCSYIEGDIKGKDIDTGKSYTVATGPDNQSYPAIADKSVVWVENNDLVTKLMMKDLDASSTTVIKSVSLGPNPNTTFASPFISREYVIWAELGLSNPNTWTQPVHLFAYDRKTYVIRSIAQYNIPRTIVPVYALYGSHIAWQDEAVHLMDLDAGKTAILNTSDVLTLALDDKYIVWSRRSEINGSGFDIYGTTLSDLKQMPLVVGNGNHWDPAIVGDWLVWANDGWPNDRSVGSIPLADVFKTATRH